MKNLILASVLCLASFVLSAKTVSFYAPKNGGTNGLVLVAAGDRQKPYWANVVGDVMYQHNIYAYDSDSVQFIAFSFINNVSTAYADGIAVSQALYNLGHMDKYTSIAANGNTGSALASKGGYIAVYGSNDASKSFYFFKVTTGSWSYEAWDGAVCDTVTPVSHSTLAVNSGVSSSGLSFNDIYPVGSIYFNVGETLPPIFTAEGRTWVKITNGTFLMSADGTTTVAGATGGENSKTLTTANMPAHTHGPGTLNLTGEVGRNGGSGLMTDGSYSSGVFRSGGSKSYGPAADVSGTFYMIKFQASGNWSGATASNGSSTPFDNRPSFLAVSMWKRTN